MSDESRMRYGLRYFDRLAINSCDNDDSDGNRNQRVRKGEEVETDFVQMRGKLSCFTLLDYYHGL